MTHTYLKSLKKSVSILNKEFATRVEEQQRNYDNAARVAEKESLKQQSFKIKFDQLVIPPIKQIFEECKSVITSPFVHVIMESHLESKYFEFFNEDCDNSYIVISIDLADSSTFQPFERVSFAYFLGQHESNSIRLCIVNKGYQTISDLDQYDTSSYDLEFSLDDLPLTEIFRILTKYLSSELNSIKKTVSITQEYPDDRLEFNIKR